MDRTVAKRLVFYCPGYDPEAETRYRRLFVTGLAQTARRFGIAREVGPIETDPAVPALRWSVIAGKAGWRTETAYELLCWHDLVEGDLSRSWFTRLPLLLAALVQALRDGVIPKVFRIDWQFGLMMLYPWAALVGLIAAGIGAGYGAALLAALVMPIGLLPKLLLAGLVAGGLLASADRFLRRIFLYLMLDAWVFNWQHASGRRPDFEARLERFCEHVLDAVRTTDADEVLIVGHSTGAVVAVEIAARALACEPGLGLNGAAVALLTTGGELPFVGMVRRAERLRADIARLATARSLLWLDYQAPQDPLNAFGFDPVRDLGLDLGGRPRLNPVVRSPRFKDLLSAKTYRRIRYNFFRVHFQFLMANEVAGEYDFFTMTCGPVSLRDRVADPLAALQTIYGPGFTLPSYLAASADPPAAAAINPQPHTA